MQHGQGQTVGRNVGTDSGKEAKSSLPAAAVVPAPLATATSPMLARESVVATTPTKVANMMPAA